MNGSRNRLIHLPLARWMAINTGLLVLQGAIWSVTAGFTAVYSALIGGLIAVIPNAYFAQRAFRFQGARTAQLMVNEIFRGEAIKLSLTAVFFAAVFILIEPVHVPALLFTFAVMVVTGAVLPWLIQPKRRQR